MLNQKGVILALLFLYFAIITLMAQSLGLVVTDGFIETIQGVTGEGGFGGFVANLGTYMAVFFSMLAFQVELPFILILIFVHTPTVMMIWFLAELIRGN
jgi:hypothetical protein